MSIAERQARDKEELRRKILEAASSLFVEQGPEGVSIRKVADKIDYAPSTIYLYFNDKADLLGNICLETFTGLSARLEEIRSRDLPPLSSLEAGLRTYILFGIQNPNHYYATFSVPWMKACPVPSGDYHGVVEKVAFQSFGHLRESVRRCMEAGVIRRSDLETTCQNLWMFIHGITSLCIQAAGGGHFPWRPQQELIDSAMDILMRGLRPEP